MLRLQQDWHGEYIITGDKKAEAISFSSAKLQKLAGWLFRFIGS
jgi:hypothetical protein